MSIATVHYLSMNVRNGLVTPTGTVTNAVANSVAFSSLNPSEAVRINWGFAAGLTVTNKALTSNVATLTVGANGWAVGDVVTVTGVDATFNGTYTLTARSATTISYAKTAADVGSAASGGTVAGYTPATANGSGTVSVSVTYPTAGVKQIIVTDNVTGQTVASRTITVA